MAQASLLCTIGFLVELLEVPRSESVKEARAAIRDLQCVTLVGQVLFSLTIKESITYSSAAGLTTETFDIPYANCMTLPGAVSGRPGEASARIIAHTVRLEQGKAEAACEVDIEVLAAVP